MMSYEPIQYREPPRIVLSEFEQKQVVRKVTSKILPWLCLLYLLAHLDRANLANAKYLIVFKPDNSSDCNNTFYETNYFDSENCTETQSRAFITEEQYGIVVSLFYLGYMVFEVPSNLLMKKTSAPTWISRIMVSWGIVTTFTLFAHDAFSLIICRFLLGVMEAGFFPGVMYYLTLWFVPKDRAVRIAIFYMMSPVSGFVGGILSYGILQLDGVLNFSGWQWLCILEGTPSIIIGIITWFYLPDRPENCRFLNEDEKSWLIRALSEHSEPTSDHRKISCSEIVQVLKSWKLWLFCMISMGHNVIGAVVTFFLPAIIADFGVDGLLSNLLSAPPNFIAILCLLIISWNSDRTRERSKHLLLPFTFQILAWGVVSLCFFYRVGISLMYVSIIIAVGVHYSFPPIFWAWLTQEFKQETSVATSTAFVSTIGTSSQIWSPLMTTAIYGIAQSYVWVIVSLCGFGILGLICGIILSIYLMIRKSHYTRLTEESREVRNGRT